MIHTDTYPSSRQSDTGKDGYAAATVIFDALTGDTYIKASGRDWGKMTCLSHEVIKASVIRSKIASMLACRTWYNTTGGYP